MDQAAYRAQSRQFMGQAFHELQNGGLRQTARFLDKLEARLPA